MIPGAVDEQVKEQWFEVIFKYKDGIETSWELPASGAFAYTNVLVKQGIDTEIPKEYLFLGEEPKRRYYMKDVKEIVWIPKEIK